MCAGMTLSLVVTAIYDDPSYKPGAKRPGPDVAFICLCAAALLACGIDAILGAAVMIIRPRLHALSSALLAIAFIRVSL